MFIDRKNEILTYIFRLSSKKTFIGFIIGETLMALTIQEMRAKLEEEKAKSENSGNRSRSDNASYPFWDIPVNSTAVVRFLPDADETNDWFWRDRSVIDLPFEGVKGHPDHNKSVIVRVPCMQMFTGKKQDCPILMAIDPWWKDESRKADAKKYYRKHSRIYQGFVVSSSLEEENPPENTVRRFIMGSSLNNIIKNKILDPDMDANPTDFADGYDFKIVKSKKGEYNNYDSSDFSRKSRSLTEKELDALETFGLFNLSEFLPSRPDEERINVIQKMFEDSIAGLPYDPDKYAEYYTPIGVQLDGSSHGNSGGDVEVERKTPVQPSYTRNEAVNEQEPVKKETPQASAPTVVRKTPQELLAELRAKSESKQQ